MRRASAQTSTTTTMAATEPEDNEEDDADEAVSTGIVAPDEVVAVAGVELVVVCSASNVDEVGVEEKREVEP